MRRLVDILEDNHDRVMSRRAYLAEYFVYERTAKEQKRTELTEEEKRQVDEFWIKNYGKKITYKFHEVYKYDTGKFDPKYFPEHLLRPRLAHYINPRSFIDVFEDKNTLPLLAERAHVRMPEIIIYNVNDIFYNNNHEIITRDEALNILTGVDEAIVKPSIESSGGKGISFVKNPNMDESRELLDKYKRNFAIQKVVKNHKCLSDIHPDSVNTIRVVTYFFKGEICHCPVVLRMGVGDSRVDNATSGGVLTGINDDGTLLKYAINRYCTHAPIERHPDTNIKFEGYQIYNFDKVLASAKKMHSLLPQVGIIDWDFSLDEDGEPILIEANIFNAGGVRMSQWVHGKGAFGDNTAEILQWLAKVEKMPKSLRQKEKVHL